MTTDLQDGEMTTTPAPRDEQAKLEQWANDNRIDPNLYVVFTTWHGRAAIAESELAEAREQNEVFEGGLRALACSLSAGGYNAEKLSAAQLLEKVSWGVDEFAKSTSRLLDSVRAERDELRAELERVKADNRAKNGSMKAFGEQIAKLQRAVKNRDKMLAKAAIGAIEGEAG